MRRRLRLVVWPHDAVVDLDRIETTVLRQLEPPLNISKVITPWTRGSEDVTYGKKTRRVTLNELEAHLWESANILRGPVDQADFKSYVFPLLFLKRISDVYDEEFQEALDESDGDVDYASVAENHRFQVPEGAHWNDLRERTDNVGQAIQQAMRTIEQVNSNKLYGIFGDTQWTNKERLPDSLLRDLVDPSQSCREALTAILAEMGLKLKPAKTRIVHLREGGEGVDFLGFHHRYVRGHTRRSRHFTFLVRWPSRQAMGHARQRVREITARSRLRVPVEVIVRDLNRFLRGWAGYFRYGNSAQFFDKITLHTLRCLAGFIAKRHKRRKRYGWWVVAHQTHRMGRRPQRHHRRAAANATTSGELNASGQERR